MAKTVKPEVKSKPQGKVKPKVTAKRRFKAKPKTLAKKQTNRPSIRVPAELVFYCNDGSVFADLRDLAEGLAVMSDETFAYHSNLDKHDFANWVKDVIMEEELANVLAGAVDRLQAAECVTARLDIII